VTYTCPRRRSQPKSVGKGQRPGFQPDGSAALPGNRIRPVAARASEWANHLESHSPALAPRESNAAPRRDVLCILRIRLPCSARSPHRRPMLLESSIFGPILRHLLTVGGFLLAIFLIARLMSEKTAAGKHPGVAARHRARSLCRSAALSAARQAASFVDWSRGSPASHRCRPGNVRDVGAAQGAAAHALVLDGGVSARGRQRRAPANRLGNRRTRNSNTTSRGPAYHPLLMTFILGRDDTGRRIVELLAQRAATA